MIGVGRVTIGINQDFKEKINTIKLHGSDLNIENSWELTGLSVSVKTYSDSSAVFESSAL